MNREEYLASPLGQWLEAQFDAGRKDLHPDDPFWRDHFCAAYIQESFDAGERVPLGVLLVSNEPLTEKEIQRGYELYEKHKDKFNQ